MTLNKIVKVLALVMLIFGPDIGICSEMVQYQYDELNRLKQATYGDGTVIEYSYDEIGNLTSRTVTGPTRYSLAVSKSGSGTVTSDQSGIDCGSDCAESYTAGALITLTATPATGYLFDGWSGSCSGTGSCNLTMTGNKSVTATFSQAALTVSKSGTGSGTVTSSPSGISCGSDCSQDYNNGTSVTLTATADSTSNFSGWSGSCSGTGSCTVTMTSDISVTASFDLPTLTVSKTGIGTGTLTSSPSGISCGSDCTQDYNKGTSVTLTATADSAWDFIKWTGSCSGTGTTCQLTMSADTSATAEFGCLSQPVKIFGKAYYPTIQAAYNAAVPGDVVQVRSITLTENVNAFRDILVTIDGGFNCHFTSNPDATTIRGQLTVSSGKVVVKNVNIQY